MGQPAARVGDMHMCPMVTPGVPPIPHVGGPILPPGQVTVLIGGQPAAGMGDMCTCVGPPDSITKGSTGVMINKKPAARMGDPTAHGGLIALGLPTVLIGETEVTDPNILMMIVFLAALLDSGQLTMHDLQLMAQSPTLMRKFKQIQAEGGRITVDDEPGASTNKPDIRVGRKEAGGLAMIQTLAHESGHDTYTPPEVPMAGSTEQQYVQGNTKAALGDEGEATLTNMEVRDEIKSGSGEDIGVAGNPANTSQYEQIQRDYQADGDRDRARDRIGQIYGNGERTSLDNKPYNQYYGDAYQKEWNDAHPPTP
ncbi:PAAR domain-containing protein [Spirosoma koreense]